MNNKTGFNRLGLKTGHRRALKCNMATSLFKYERVVTIKSRAKEVSRFSEKLITRAKCDTVFNRRLLAKSIHDKKILSKLFSDLGKYYKLRNGGYTRIVKVGLRKGDAANMVVLELVDRREKEKISSISKKTSRLMEQGDVQASIKEKTKKSGYKRASGQGGDLGSVEKSTVLPSRRPQRGGGSRGK